MNHSPTMNVVELIRKKRAGTALTEGEFRFLISGYVDGIVPDYQMSSFLMACYFRGMSEDETLTFTRLMLHSGETIDLTDIPGVKVDKHSTGGVGDKVSLILTPIVASCGVPVPMISGRGLAHTGGTLDKLDAIPGFKTNLSIAEYKKIIRQIGVVMIGQTKEIAPADKKMYALRDVTATVECIPLIAGSIMSKKLAGGANALVLDVKTGRGAFMRSYEKSLELATALVKVGNELGIETVGYITDMNQPLGSSIGNWLEVVESVECLRGSKGMNDHAADLMEVTHLLAGAMLMLGKKANNIQTGIELSKQAIASGNAYQKFLELVRTQGGDISMLENVDRYPRSKFSAEATAPRAGWVVSVDALETGLTATMLGAGREKIDDAINHKAGIVLNKKVGDRIEMGETLAILYTDRENVLDAARKRIAQAFAITPTKPEKQKLIYAMISKEGAQPWQ
ncbi:MAG TPA: thymidine phosphorylase [Bacteroidota bacterium]